MILASAVASAGAALLLGEAVHAAAAVRARRLPARVTPGSTGVVVVLGFQDHGARANMVNRWRARIAVRTARRAEALRATVTILCSGGAVQGQIPEADLLARFIRDGLGWDGPLVTEASSRSTWENVANSLPSLEHADWVAFASNGLHAEKARLYLRRQRPDIAARSVPADDYRFGEMIPVKPIFAAVGVAKLFSAFHVKHR